MVGGSLASSVHGFFRSTNDIDLVAAIEAEHAGLFASRLAVSFYVDAETIRAGGEQSERQWNDVRGIRSVQGGQLDRAYMKQWARHLNVEDLLERLFSEKESA